MSGRIRHKLILSVIFYSQNHLKSSFTLQLQSSFSTCQHQWSPFPRANSSGNPISRAKSNRDEFPRAIPYSCHVRIQSESNFSWQIQWEPNFTCKPLVGSPIHVPSVVVLLDMPVHIVYFDEIINTRSISQRPANSWLYYLPQNRHRNETCIFLEGQSLLQYKYSPLLSHPHLKNAHPPRCCFWLW